MLMTKSIRSIIQKKKIEHSLKDLILIYTEVHKSWILLGRKNVYVLLLSDVSVRFFFQNTMLCHPSDKDG